MSLEADLKAATDVLTGRARGDATKLLERILNDYENNEDNQARIPDLLVARAIVHVHLAYLTFYDPPEAAPPGHEIRIIMHHFTEAETLYNSDMRLHPHRVDPMAETSPITETLLGILLSQPLNPNHDLERAYQHFQNAHNQGCKHATYWLGRARYHGFGVVADLSAGFQLFQQAASHKIRRALFQIASMLEEGREGGSGPFVRKNPSLAIRYYQAVTTRQELDEWSWDYAVSHAHFNKEYNEMANILSAYIGSVLSWGFAGQAFLFGAAATLSAATVNPEHYPTLPLLLPIMGMIVALISFVTGFHTYLENRNRRQTMMVLYKAKMKACESLAAGPIFDCKERLVGPYPPPSSWQDLRQHDFLTLFGETFAVLLPILFYGVWFALFVEELIRRGLLAIILGSCIMGGIPVTVGTTVAWVYLYHGGLINCKRS